jgi:hypothetical protein
MSDCNDKKRKSEEKPELKTSDSNNENVITKVKKKHRYYQKQHFDPKKKPFRSHTVSVYRVVQYLKDAAMSRNLSS